MEFKGTESVLWQGLYQAREELEKKDSELQAVSKGLKAVNRLTEGVKAELDCERIVFQDQKEPSSA